jgi:DNA-binding PadR family transcriptional regulator
MVDYLILAWLTKFGESYADDIWHSLKGMIPVALEGIEQSLEKLHKRGLLWSEKKTVEECEDEVTVFRINGPGTQELAQPVQHIPTPLEMICALWLTDNNCRGLIDARKALLNGLWIAGGDNPHEQGAARILHDYYFAAISQELAILDAIQERSC